MEHWRQSRPSLQLPMPLPLTSPYKMDSASSWNQFGPPLPFLKPLLSTRVVILARSCALSQLLSRCRLLLQGCRCSLLRRPFAALSWSRTSPACVPRTSASLTPKPQFARVHPLLCSTRSPSLLSSVLSSTCHLAGAPSVPIVRSSSRVLVLPRQRHVQLTGSSQPLVVVNPSTPIAKASPSLLLLETCPSTPATAFDSSPTIEFLLCHVVMLSVFVVVALVVVRRSLVVVEASAVPYYSVLESSCLYWSRVLLSSCVIRS